MQRLFERLNGSLGLLLILPQTLVGGVPTALSGFCLLGVLFEGIWYAPSTVVLAMHEKGHYVPN